MDRSSLALGLLLATPLLWGCNTGSDVKEPSPWAITFGADGQAFPLIAVDPSGAVAMAGAFQSDLDLGKGVLQGSPFDDDVFVSMFGTDGTPRWDGASDAPGDQLATGVAFDPDGNIVMIGAFTNEVSFGGQTLTAPQSDAFLVKIDRSGKTTLVKHWSGDDGGPSGAGTIRANDMVATSDGITFGGSFTGSVGFGGPPLESTSMFNDTSFVARVDHEGRHVFSLSFGGQSNHVDALAVDDAGDVYVTGTNSFSVDIGGGSFGTGGQNCEFVARLGADGTPRWAFQVGVQTTSFNAGSSIGGPIAVDRSGDVFVGGTYSGDVVIDRHQLSSFNTSGFVMKVSSQGKVLWVHDFPSATVTSLGINDEGRLVVGGGYTGPSDFGGGMLPDLGTMGAFITTLEPAKGKHQGTLILGVPDFQSEIWNLVVTGKDVIVTGNFTGSLDLLGKTLTQTTDNGFGVDFLARINL